MATDTKHVLPPAGDRGDIPEPRLSDMIQNLAQRTESTLSISDLVIAMQSRARGALVIVIALPNLLPIGLPGMSAVLGLPLVFLTIQILLGQPAWFPEFINKREIKQSQFATVARHTLPWLKWAERYVQPRMISLTNPLVERGVGALSVFLALTVMLPVPLGNMLPALAIIFFTLGIMERDGVYVVAGAITTVAALAVVSTVIGATIQGAYYLFVGTPV